MQYFLVYQVGPVTALALLFLLLERTRLRPWMAPAVFAAGAAVQLALWWRVSPALDNPDSAGFWNLAHGLENDLRSILYRPKLYPLFLGLFPGLKSAALAQCLLKLSMGLIFLRAAKLLEWRPGITAAALFLFLFNALWLREPLRIMDTTVFTFFFTVFFWLTAESMRKFSPAKFLLLCFSAGLASLTRQVGDAALALVLLLIPFTPEIRGKIRFPVLLAGFSLALATAGSGAAYNGFKHGVFQRTVALGVNLYTHSSYFELADPFSPEWSFVHRYLPEERERCGPWVASFKEDIPWTVNALPHNLARALGGRSGREMRRNDALLAGRFFHWARENPKPFLASVRNEALRLLWKCEEAYPSSLLEKIFPVGPTARKVERGLLHQPPFLLLALGILGIGLGRRANLPLTLMALGVFTYLGLVAAIQLGFTRYSLPVIPILLLLAGSGLQTLFAYLVPPPRLDTP